VYSSSHKNSNTALLATMANKSSFKGIAGFIGQVQRGVATRAEEVRIAREAKEAGQV
jgi:hypothetical protein